jgi:hypothetical protein
VEGVLPRCRWAACVEAAKGKSRQCGRLRHDPAKGLLALTGFCGEACITEGEGLSGLQTVVAAE